MGLVKWLKDKIGITALERENAELKSELYAHRQFVVSKMAELKEFTRVDADVGFRGNNTVILTGVYRNKAYVQFYDLGDGEFVSLVNRLKDMKSHALIRHVDAPLTFHSVFDL